MKRFLIDVLISIVILTIMLTILHAIFGEFNNWIALSAYIFGGIITDIKRMNEHGSTE